MTQKYLSHPLLVFYPHKTVRKDLIDRNHAGSSKPALLRCFAIRRGLCRCPAMNWSARN